ncbi:hypothetical protein FQA39_LY12509 [Lamprigera yunnana]|nr:hypothetical protein FQA39_LY12509 [Lamprigera yunnana]
MASIQQYVCESEQFAAYIIKNLPAYEKLRKERHFIVLKIQAYWRGHRVRKEIRKWHQAATVLQKYVRRWLVIWHLPEIYRNYYEWYMEMYYHKMATRIQALWRGYRVRRDGMSPKESLQTRLASARANSEMTATMKNAFATMKKLKMEKLDEESKGWVLFIFFKLHHHLRTYQREGIYSEHNSKKLSSIENMLKCMPFDIYMRQLKNIYYKEITIKKPKPPYMFKDRRMQELEDFYRNRDRSYEPKDIFVPDRNIHEKPFIRSSKVPEKPYEKSIFTIGKYSTPRAYLGRPVVKAEHMSNSDFDLFVYKKAVPKEVPPPYRLDHWFSRCTQHGVTE